MWHCRSRYRDGQNYTHELSGCHLQSSYGKKNPATAYRKEDSKKNQATGQQHIEKRVQLKSKITVIHCHAQNLCLYLLLTRMHVFGDT